MDKLKTMYEGCKGEMNKKHLQRLDLSGHWWQLSK